MKMNLKTTIFCLSISLLNPHVGWGASSEEKDLGYIGGIPLVGIHAENPEKVRITIAHGDTKYHGDGILVDFPTSLDGLKKLIIDNLPHESIPSWKIKGIKVNSNIGGTEGLQAISIEVFLDGEALPKPEALHPFFVFQQVYGGMKFLGKPSKKPVSLDRCAQLCGTHVTDIKRFVIRSGSVTMLVETDDDVKAITAPFGGGLVAESKRS
jgi:hypothetical protein